MGRSLRSKQALKAKSIKRKGVFTDIVDARAERLAQKLKQNQEKQKSAVKEEVTAEKVEEAAKKTSTSGWRTSRHVTFKKNKIKKNKRRAALLFKK